MLDDGRVSIIVDPEALKETYIPPRLKARENQTEQILCCLSPITIKHKPFHIWLHGKPGTGKTSTAIHALRALENNASFRSIIINCWEKRSFYEILDEMVYEFRILRASEHRASFKLERLRSFLAGAPILVVLDEVDQIRRAELSTVLYNLDSVLNAGLICISSSMQALLEIEERVRSRLNPHTITFPAYSRKDLLEILAHRAGLALAEGSWSHAALNRIAKAAKGDARAAICMLHRAAVLASHQGKDRIAAEALKEQINSARESQMISILNGLTKDHQMLYEIVKQQGQILSGDLWEKYLQRCDGIKRKPLASRTFSDYANRLVRTGLITAKRARVKGKVRLFTTVI